MFPDKLRLVGVMRKIDPKILSDARRALNEAVPATGFYEPMASTQLIDGYRKFARFDHLGVLGPANAAAIGTIKGGFNA
jgi:hypothetical protein